MRKPEGCCSIFLIIFCTIVLIIAAFLSFGGFGFALRMGLPIALAVLPFGEYVNGWVELPLPIDAKARLNTASSVSPEGAFVAGGQMTFDLTMTKWDNDIEPNSERPERLVPLVMVQEEAEIDQLQRYKVILTTVTLNYWNFVNWILVLVAFTGFTTGAVLKFVKRGEDSD